MRVLAIIAALLLTTSAPSASAESPELSVSETLISRLGELHTGDVGARYALLREIGAEAKALQDKRDFSGAGLLLERTWNRMGKADANRMLRIHQQLNPSQVLPGDFEFLETTSWREVGIFSTHLGRSHKHARKHAGHLVRLYRFHERYERLDELRDWIKESYPANGDSLSLKERRAFASNLWSMAYMYKFKGDIQTAKRLFQESLGVYLLNERENRAAMQTPLKELRLLGVVPDMDAPSPIREVIGRPIKSAEPIQSEQPTMLRQQEKPAPPQGDPTLARELDMATRTEEVSVFDEINVGLLFIATLIGIIIGAAGMRLYSRAPVDDAYSDLDD